MYNTINTRYHLANMERLVESSTEPGRSPDGYFMDETLARFELERMGKPIPDWRVKGIVSRGSLPRLKP